MTYNHQLTIDAKKGQFIITCPMWANDLLHDLPSRRWSKSQRAWIAPIIKQNVVVIKGLTHMGGVETTNDAVLALREYDAMVKEAGKRNSGFPAWYKFKTEPRAHQHRALAKGYGLKAYALFMDMQTGKSKTTIDLLAAHRMEGHIYGALILSKLTLRNNWVKQFELHCPIPYSIHLPSTDKERQFEQWLGAPEDFKVMVVGWESLSAGGMKKLCERFMLSLHSSAIAGDETTYITNHKSARSQEAAKLARLANYRYALTGTPVAEGPMNLFMQFEFLDPEIIGIGDFYAFRNRYAIMGGYQREIRPGLKQPTEIVGYQNIDELMGLIGPNSFQVMKTEAYDLPPKRYEVRTVQITAKQRALYNQVKKEGTLRMRGDEEHVLKNTLEVALRLHQITGGHSVQAREERKLKKNGEESVKTVYDPVEILPPDENPKMMEVMEVVKEYHGKQGIVWAVYSPEIHSLAKLLRDAGYRVGELHGGVPDADRQPMVDAFQRGEIDWVVGNAATGGMGYTMMASVVNVFYNNTFKMIDRLQAEDRAWGDGQSKPGIWIDIVAEKTVDITVMKAIEAKEDMSTYIKGKIKDITALLDGEA